MASLISQTEAPKVEGWRAGWAKDAGNQALKDKNYALAIDKYTEAITREENATLYSNRSAARVMAAGAGGVAREPARLLLRGALEDADACVALEPGWPKGHSRRGKALYMLGEHRRAADAYARGLELAMGQGRDVARSANAESEAVAAQAESQQREYLRLLDENAQLRRQLEDYELMFSGAQKKQI